MIAPSVARAYEMMNHPSLTLCARQSDDDLEGEMDGVWVRGHPSTTSTKKGPSTYDVHKEGGGWRFEKYLKFSEKLH